MKSPNGVQGPMTKNPLKRNPKVICFNPGTTARHPFLYFFHNTQFRLRD